MIGWRVYLGQHCIDTVFYTPDCDMEYVRTTLINHDGYPFGIVVRRG